MKGHRKEPNKENEYDLGWMKFNWIFYFFSKDFLPVWSLTKTKKELMLKLTEVVSGNGFIFLAANIILTFYFNMSFMLICLTVPKGN